MYKVALNAVAWFLKNMPLLGIAVVTILVVGHFNNNQERIIEWQKLHGEHSKLVHTLIVDTEKRLNKSDKAMDKVQDALYKVSLVINALQSSAERIDKVRDKEVKRLLSRAKLLKHQLHLNRDAARVQRNALVRQLQAYQLKLERLQRIQRVKEGQHKRRPLDL